MNLKNFPKGPRPSSRVGKSKLSIHFKPHVLSAYYGQGTYRCFMPNHVRKALGTAVKEYII